MGKYTTIQIKRDLYEQLHHYCAENGYSKSGLVEKLIEKRLGIETPKSPTALNILRVNSKT